MPTDGPTAMRRASLAAAAVPLGVAFVVALVLGVFALQKADPFVVGDEPHYVVMASSLVHDHDLDLANNYTGPKAVFPTLDPGIHAFHYRAHGPLAPVHAPGLAVLLAPFIAVRDTMYSARVGMVVIWALMAAALLSLLRAVAGRINASVVIAWAVVVTALPVLVFSFEVYPDIPGALFVTLALRLLVNRRFRLRHAAGVGACAAWLPWLHVRLGIVAVPLAAAAVVRLWRTLDARTWRDRVRSSWPVGAPFAVGLLALALVFWHLYGSPLPGAPYRIEPFTTANQFTWLKAYRFGLGSLLGLTPGLIPYAPVFWFGVVGLAWFTGQLGWRLVALTGVVAGLYLAVVGGHGPVVNAFPGRTVLVFVPVLALGLLGALQSTALVAVGVVATAALGLGISYQGVRNLVLLMDTGDLRLPIERRIAPAFPWFTVPPGATGRAFNLALAAGPGGPRQTLFQSETMSLRAGMYDLAVSASVPAASRSTTPTPVLGVRVVHWGDGMPYEEWTLWSSDIAAHPVTTLRFQVPDLQLVQVEFDYPGTASSAVSVTSARIDVAGRGLVPVRTASTDVPLTALWIGMSALVIALLPRARSRPTGG